MLKYTRADLFSVFIRSQSRVSFIRIIILCIGRSKLKKKTDKINENLSEYILIYHVIIPSGIRFTPKRKKNN